MAADPACRHQFHTAQNHEIQNFPHDPLVAPLSGLLPKDDDLMTPDYSATIGFKAGVSETPAEVRSAFSQPSQLFTLGQKSDSLQVTAESIPFPSRPATRAQLTTDPAQIGEIGVCAYASWSSRPLIASELYAKGADGVFRSSGNPVYWPGNPDLPIDFYVFSPCSAQGFTAPQAGATTFDYTLPSSAEDQTDLMLDVQKNIPGDYNAILPLNFRHLLTAVQVNIKSLPTGAVAKSVSISGVHSGGTLTMSENPAWTYSGELKTTYANFNGAASASFLLLPQEVVGGEMTMSIVLSEGSKERTVTAAIPARTWAMGGATAYNVAIEDYDIEFLNKTRVVDAHYCIYKTEVETTGFPADQDWTLSTPTEGVTIQLEADVNQVARQGFWTNKIIRNGTLTNESARGTNSVSGTGSTKISVWILCRKQHHGRPRHQIRALLRLHLPSNRRPHPHPEIPLRPP